MGGLQERVEVIRQATPIEMRVTGNTVVAILKSGNGRPVNVELREVARKTLRPAVPWS